MNSQLTNNISQTDFNLKKAIIRYLKHWKWFAFSAIVFLVLAYFHLRYTEPVYSAQAKIMLVDEKSSGAPGKELLRDLQSFSEVENKKTEDEIEVLKSRKLMENVVKELSLNKQFHFEGRFHNSQLFKNIPININFIASDSIVNEADFKFTIEFLSEESFNINFKEDEIPTKAFFGKSIDTPIGDMILTPNFKEFNNVKDKVLSVRLRPVFKVAESYREKVTITQIKEFSKVINLSLKDTNKDKAISILNTLISEYNRNSIEDRNERSKNAADFINERISLIASDLSQVDDKIERFKTANKLTNITSEVDLYLNSSAQVDQELAETKTQLNQISYMKNVIGSKSMEYDYIPSDIGMSNPSITNITNKYNDLLRERNNLLKGSTTEKNPIIVNLDQQLSSLKSSLNKSLNNLSKSTEVRMRSLQNRYSELNSKVYAVPGQVRKSRDIEREQGTKESILLYLLEKREEAAISLTSTSPGVKIIDEAYSSGLPVSPNKKMAFIAALLVGLCIPFGVIYASDVLDTKIHNKEDLQKVFKNMTVLGEIPRLTNSDKLLIEKNDRSILSESFRIIRTNADYIRKGRKVENYNNVIFVTSTINGEGKSFFSMNMALTMANTGKKVLVIGADVRNPQIFPAIKKALNTKEIKNGLTEFLVDDAINVKDVVNTHLINDIKVDVLLSGKVPPNPAELLMGDRVKELFDNVSQEYDYVIVDTAPSMLVTDTILISQYAGHTIYLTRANYTEKEILNFAKELHDDKKLNGMMLVVNDVKQSNFGYGAKYGYYGTPPKKRWFSFGKS
ncbi:GumC family protein [Jejuia pallidilutea]|uniref:non-specific protein-tyrosine kinase n=1 Tax=Jejuia pallidilutea TaxID=504487 RepID=A0A090VSW6_9FLAO|nr:polysaccharide biosynthesis tyrosine autokinase [Jejuia pallidilutea]GAL67073.1 tyrosine-protein kinase Wzc [Jejuia pallidilutea]GAL90643.1 tyrosine-protein kinase Wzc [Jejuia pallidilutea]